ncbi:hypothetical protein ACFTWR_16730 [Streptomyces nigra]|uniref:hypothetical protein n=1 Tax=Streptomyces nigra TaxID=1827580 RepID=UPI00362C6BE4
MFAVVRQQEDEGRRSHHRGGGAVHDRQNDHTAAAHELRRRLSDALALARENKAQFAQKVRLERTIVQLAFQADGPMLSPETLAAPARVLKLPVNECWSCSGLPMGSHAGTSRGRQAGRSGPVGAVGRQPFTVSGSLPGQAYQCVEVIPEAARVQAGDAARRRWWVAVTDGVERLGVLRADTDADTEAVRQA